MPTHEPTPEQPADEATAVNNSQYQNLPRLHPFAPIPGTKKEAVESAERHYNELKRTNPELVAQFDTAFAAWRAVWFGESGDDWAKDSEEYVDLLDFGPQIIPLVVYELSKPKPMGFGACCLYNDLEKDKHFKVDPEDILNFATLNRQASLIVELNFERNKSAGSPTE